MDDYFVLVDEDGKKIMDTDSIFNDTTIATDSLRVKEYTETQVPHIEAARVPENCTITTNRPVYRELNVFLMNGYGYADSLLFKIQNDCTSPCTITLPSEYEGKNVMLVYDTLVKAKRLTVKIKGD